MDSEMHATNNQPCTSNRILAAAGPVLWVAIGYIDPGKWAAAIEGGARLGFDIVLLMLVINCATILCQYLSARVAIATGKDLARLCREEYGGTTYLCLGTQAEISWVVMDLTMVLGTAFGLNAVFGIDLYHCVFLTGIDAVLFPLIANHFENPRAQFASVCLASFVLLWYICGLLITRPESSVSFGGMLNKLSGENAYLLMGLLGANIMPHNFYLHSSLVQRGLGQTSSTKWTLFHDHFFAIVGIFGGILLVNIRLMNWAAYVFHSNGLVQLTSQDALSLLDQVFRSSIASVCLVMIMFLSNQLISLPWSLGSRLISKDCFKLDIPCWLDRAATRAVSIFISLYFVWSSGADGIFQLLIFTQVVVALLLPSSVIPLFLFASSESIMGAYRISNLLKFLALVTFVGLLGMKIFFVIEMIFGNSEWANSLCCNSFSMLHLVFLLTASAALYLMFRLVTTPLKSEISEADTRALQWAEKTHMVEKSEDREQPASTEAHEQQESGIEKQESAVSLDKPSENQQRLSTPDPNLNLPESFLDYESNHLTTIEENKTDFGFPKPGVKETQPSPQVPEVVLPEIDVAKSESLDASTLSTEPKAVVEKRFEVEADVRSEKDDDGYNWEPPEESSKYVTESNNNFTSEGSGSFRSISGKFDDTGSGTGSLSRLAGLGRAARRQLTGVLDDFWGQLFDFHGQVTPDARVKKLDNLLGIDPKVDSKSSMASVKMESLSKDSTGYFSSPGVRGSEAFKTPTLYSSMQQMGQSNVGSPLAVQQGSAMWSNQMNQLDAYVRSSSQTAVEASERRYYSVHVPSSNDAYDQQPATIHGYELASYLGRMAKETGSDNVKGQYESMTRTSSLTTKSNTSDPYVRPMGTRPQNGLRMARPPGFHNVPVSRNISLKPERPYQDLSTPEPVDYSSNTANVKKYYSLPSISGLYVPRTSSVSGNISQVDYSTGYGQSMNRMAREQTLSSASSWAGTGLGLNPLSSPHSKLRKDDFSLHYGSGSGTSSLWSKQPYERFGVADKSPPKYPETATSVDLEVKVLQSFRSCINKLLKLEGSDWLFRQNDGADEDLIDRVAAREKFLFEVETRTSALKPDDADHSKIMSVPNCGDACVWKVDLIISFGVWCIHRILELSLMESRPELWGKYTYVLNRLQGIIDPAFSKPRSSMSPCFCLELPAGYQMKSIPPLPSDGLPPPSKLARGKFTTAPMLLEMIKDVELAISCRKGRTGTAAGDVAFPKGKENLASVLKRYKRRLANKPVVVPQEAGAGAVTRKGAASSPPHHQGL